MLDYLVLYHYFILMASLESILFSEFKVSPKGSFIIWHNMEDPLLWVYAGFELTLALYISLSNFVVIFVYMRSKHIRTPTNAYIFSLALTDFLAGALGIPFTVAASMNVTNINVVYSTIIRWHRCLPVGQALTSHALPFTSSCAFSAQFQRSICWRWRLTNIWQFAWRGTTIFRG